MHSVSSYFQNRSLNKAWAYFWGIPEYNRPPDTTDASRTKFETIIILMISLVFI